MRKKQDRHFSSRGAQWWRALAGMALAGLTVCAALASHFLLFQSGALAHNSDPSTPTPALLQTATQAPAPENSPYLYFVLKQDGGFVLARAHAGQNNQPADTPQTVASFDGAFGASTADSVISLQISPGGRYLAIDGTHSDAELLWIFDTLTSSLRREPAGVSGTFLHWLSNASGLFLYRPVLPLGPGAPLNTADWNPGLWVGNAALGTFMNINLHLPSTFLVDATVSPDGLCIVYSTSRGMGLGSDIWSIDARGHHQAHLLHLSNSGQSVAGMFTWSPDGQHLAYERLDDSPTPFLPAGLWIMDRQGSNQRLLAQADGGHGFALHWSPDSKKIAFVARINSATPAADQSTQALQSAIKVVDVASGHVWPVASPAQTGVQINASPAWSANSQQITFAAFNPLNPELGGTVRYWCVQARPAGIHPSVVAVSPAIEHVIAPGQL